MLKKMNENFKKCIKEETDQIVLYYLDHEEEFDDNCYKIRTLPGYTIFFNHICEYENLYENLYNIQKFIFSIWSKHKANKTPNFSLLVCFFVCDCPNFEDVNTNTPVRLLCKLLGNKTEEENYKIYKETCEKLLFSSYVPIEAVGRKLFVPCVYLESINPLSNRVTPPLYTLLNEENDEARQ